MADYGPRTTFATARASASAHVAARTVADGSRGVTTRPVRGSTGERPGRTVLSATASPGASSRLFTCRTDGFVASRGGAQGGIVTTKLFQTSGTNVELNYVLQDGGKQTVEALDGIGKVIGTSEPLAGDAVDGNVVLKRPPDVGGGPVALCFLLTHADVYAMRFR